MRDNFSQKTKSALAHRVGFKCSNPDCRKLTSGPSAENQNKHVNIGVAAHISAASEGGPRYDGSMSTIQRASFDNGIWLCQSCSKLVDSDSLRFSKKLLLVWKSTAEELALAEISSNTSLNNHSGDVALLKFYMQCFDRPAFTYPIVQEGNIEDFEKAIEDTIIALNTGVLRTRNGEILKSHEGKSCVENNSWRKKLDTVGDILLSIKHRLVIARDDKVYWSDGYGRYCFNDREVAEWFDLTRMEIIKILNSMCDEAKVKNRLEFPRSRYK